MDSESCETGVLLWGLGFMEMNGVYGFSGTDGASGRGRIYLMREGPKGMLFFEDGVL